MTIFDVISAKKKRKAELEEASELQGKKGNVQVRVQEHQEVRTPVNPPGLEKSEEEGAAELEALREKQRKRGK